MALAAFGQPASGALNLPVSLINAQNAQQQPSTSALLHPAVAGAAAAAGSAAASHLAAYAGAPSASDSLAGYSLGGTANGYGGYGGASGSALGYGSQAAPSETTSEFALAKPDVQAQMQATPQASQSGYEGLTGMASFMPTADPYSASAGLSWAKPAPSASALPPSVFDSGNLNAYEKAYNDSLAASRSTIDSQYRAALADINQREHNADQAIGLLPGEVNSVYGAGKAQLAQGLGALDATQAASGIHSYASGAAQQAPLAAAMANDQSARIADVPLLNIGASSQFSRERGNLSQDELSAIDSVNQEQRQGLLSQIAAQQNAQAADDAARRNYYYASLPQPGQGTTGAPPVGFTPQQADSMRQSPLYTQLVTAIQAGQAPQDIIKAKFTNGLGGPALTAYVNQLINLATHDATGK